MPISEAEGGETMAREAKGGPGPLARAIRLAAVAHGGQVDLAGAPYVLHPLRVMAAVRSAGYEESVQVAAVLHDVVEDTDVMLRDVEDLFGAEVAGLVDVLSRRKLPQGGKESRDAYLGRVIAAGPRVLVIKFADLKDHLVDGASDFLHASGRSEMAERYAAELSRVEQAFWAAAPERTRVLQ